MSDIQRVYAEYIQEVGLLVAYYFSMHGAYLKGQLPFWCTPAPYKEKLIERVFQAFRRCYDISYSEKTLMDLNKSILFKFQDEHEFDGLVPSLMTWLENLLNTIVLTVVYETQMKQKLDTIKTDAEKEKDKAKMTELAWIAQGKVAGLQHSSSFGNLETFENFAKPS